MLTTANINFYLLCHQSGIRVLKICKPKKLNLVGSQYQLDTSLILTALRFYASHYYSIVVDCTNKISSKYWSIHNSKWHWIIKCCPNQWLLTGKMWLCSSGISWFMIETVHSTHSAALSFLGYRYKSDKMKIKLEKEAFHF